LTSFDTVFDPGLPYDRSCSRQRDPPSRPSRNQEIAFQTTRRFGNTRILSINIISNRLQWLSAMVMARCRGTALHLAMSTQNEQPCCNRPRQKKHFAPRLTEHMNVNVTKSWGDVALLGCYIITGLLDSSSIMTWGSFVSMQTGK